MSEPDEKWFYDVIEDVNYRVLTFTHQVTGRVMERWLSSTGESWYLDAGLTQSTLFRNNILTECEPIPGMLTY